MRTYYRIFFAVLLVIVSGQKVNAKESVIKGTTYMFGLATSFTDSICYITTVQQVDGVTFNRKTHFLMDRNLYSEQLQKRLDADPPTGKFVTAVFYGSNKVKITKKWNKILHRYAGGVDGLTQKMLQDTDFQFKAEEYIPSEVMIDGEEIDQQTLNKQERASQKADKRKAKAKNKK